MSEVDPNGKNANEPGAKLDSGKVRPALVIQGFRKALLAISEVGTFGAAKYTDDGWKSVPDGRKRYEDALYRHLLAEGVDEQSGLPHLAHAAWNLLAMMELEQQHIDDLYESQKPQPKLATYPFNFSEMDIGEAARSAAKEMNASASKTSREELLKLVRIHMLRAELAGIMENK